MKTFASIFLVGWCFNVLAHDAARAQGIAPDRGVAPLQGSMVDRDVAPIQGSLPDQDIAPPAIGVRTLGVNVGFPGRDFSYTNTESAFLYGNTHNQPTSSWHGFHVGTRKMLDGWGLAIDGVLLVPESLTSATIYPDFAERHYRNGVIERIHPIDSLPGFALVIETPRRSRVRAYAFRTDARTKASFEVKPYADAACLARTVNQEGGANNRAWLCISMPGGTAADDTLRRGRFFAPAAVQGAPGKKHTFVFLAGEDPEAVAKRARLVGSELNGHIRRRTDRMENLLAETSIETADPEYTRGLAWTLISLDALVMNQGGRGIFAGLPWFNNYWGRDTFISLPGAALVQGRFDLARMILRSFAAHQQVDSTSAEAGRVPNFVGPAGIAYNTADGTPRFVAMARDYVLRSGDSTFIAEMYPVARRAIEGSLRHRVDSLGFLTHADAESWMDAAGPNGPWSPRGNRANDVQALWERQLEAGIWFAERSGDRASAAAWNEVRNQLLRNLVPAFLTSAGVADHLNADGSRDKQLRPNQIFLGDLLPDSLRRTVAHTVLTRLTYPYGVASLSQDDDQFHPYHVNPVYYPKDAAYHNGTVWTWVQGQLISELCRLGGEDSAFVLSNSLTKMILSRGAVGTIAELVDALPHPGEAEPRLSGTFSQAWSLAEHVRNFYNDYLGVRIDLYEHSLTIRPRLARRMGNVRAVVRAGPVRLPISIESSDYETVVTLDTRRLPGPLHARLDIVPRGSVAPPGAPLEAEIPAGAVITIRGRADETIIESAGGSAQRLRRSAVAGPAEDPREYSFLVPAIRQNLNALRPPPYPLIPHASAVSRNPSARVLIDVEDPAGDDAGTGSSRFTYPGSPEFVPGSFDIRRVHMAADSSTYYVTLTFRALSDPGWNPHYGFQLTMAAIAFDLDGGRGTGTVRIRHNANVDLPDGLGYERLILVGGGVQIEDDKGSVLAAYTPMLEDAAQPIGNTQTGTISFAIPRSIIGDLDGAALTVVVAGAQDDHGGAGIGEFRQVLETASEWNGGGRTSATDSNVYDTLIVGARR